jgi:hypothetical protein
MRIVQIRERVPKGTFINEPKGKFVEVGNIECGIQKVGDLLYCPCTWKMFFYIFGMDLQK